MGNDNQLVEIYKLLENSTNKKLIDIIKVKQKEFELSDLQLSKMLSISKSTFYRLIQNIEEGKVENIDFYEILKICQFFKIGIDEISHLYVASLNPEYIAELELARKANFIVRTFDLKSLKEVGFIDTVTDIPKIEQRIIKFFDLQTIFEYDEEIGAVLFSRTQNSSKDKMREFWVRSAYRQFEKINNPNQFDKEKLLALIPKIRPYTRYEENGFLAVVKALHNIGITVIVQKYLSKTQVRGATFVVNDKPCIVITDFNKNYSTVWFALLHETYHVLYDFEELKIWKYHLTGEVDLNLFKEDLADFFSCEILFPAEKLNYIKHVISSPQLVIDYAQNNNVHPSIIYSFFCYEERKHGNDVYPFYSKYFGKPDKLLGVIKTNPWDKETLYEEIEKIKELLVSETV